MHEKVSEDSVCLTMCRDPLFPSPLLEHKGSMGNKGAQGKAGGNELDFLV